MLAIAACALSLMVVGRLKQVFIKQEKDVCEQMNQ